MGTKIKIIIIYQYYLEENDGGRTRFNQFVRSWADKGHDITVISGMLTYNSGKKYKKYKGKYIVKECVNDNVTIIRTHVSERYNNSFVGRLLAYFSFTISSIIASLFFTGKADVVLVSSPPLFIGLSGFIASRFKRVPLIFEVRDLWPDSAIDLGVLRNKSIIKFSFILEKILYSKAVLINTLSPGIRDTLINKKGVPVNKLTMVTNGADMDVLKPDIKENWVRLKYNLQDKFIVLYTGSHGVSNNLDVVLQAALRLKDKNQIVFIFIGDGMSRESLINEAETFHLNNVLFLDMQPKKVISDFINASDVCLAILKKIETFKTVYPTKIFDYMACKKPILLGVDGVARQLVESCECGLYFEPCNVDQMISKLLQLNENPNLCTAMGNNGYECVIKNFSSKQLAEEYENKIVQAITY